MDSRELLTTPCRVTLATHSYTWESADRHIWIAKVGGEGWAKGKTSHPLSETSPFSSYLFNAPKSPLSSEWKASGSLLRGSVPLM